MLMFSPLPPIERGKTIWRGDKMKILGDRRFVEIPGERQHELPPLMIHRALHLKRMDKIMNMAEEIVEGEDLIPASPMGEDMLDHRRMDLALNLVTQYQNMRLHWLWGDDILEWIRQCEITFESRPELRHLLHGDVWPHAGRSSFVQLLEDKAVPTEGIGMEKAVSLRL